mmetsp:Transcript_64688/g.189258  ORF Transcript_64688/g.189258 Transcript_64688/m.189258 type:complete len:234 (-) Transcript_64688:47-748(-)
MVEALQPRPALGRQPGLDPGELRTWAEAAEAELQMACEIPVPESDIDQNSVCGDVVEGSPGEEEEEEADRGGIEQEEEEEAAAEEESQDPFTAVRGEWVSAKGECCIFEDHRTSRLSYEESLDNGCRLHGFLSKLDGFREEGVTMVWEAELAILESDEEPWYGPSFGERPEPVGDIQVRFLPGSPVTLESRIRVAGEDDDWQPAMILRRRKRTPAPVADGAEGVFVFGSPPRG